MLWVATLGALLALAAVAIALRHSYLRMLALRRMEEHGLVERADDDWRERVVPLVVRRPWLAAVFAVVVILVLRVVFGWPVWLALGFGCVGGALAWIAEDFWSARKEILLEEQLADGMDMMVSALRAGTTLVDALSIAAEESRRPIKIALDEVVRRLHLGDDPDVVFVDFAERVGTETSDLLGFCLTVHWRVGGTLAPALASVAMSARHRIEFTRRVRSQATEGRFSLIAILGITYVLTVLLWKAYPDRFEGFFSSEIGIGLTATVVFMQGIGLMWTTAMTRIKP